MISDTNAYDVGASQQVQDDFDTAAGNLEAALGRPVRIANDGNVGIGTAIAPIVSGGTGRTSLSIKGASEGGVLELVSGAADTDPATVGLIQFSNI